MATGFLAGVAKGRLCHHREVGEWTDLLGERERPVEVGDACVDVRAGFVSFH